MRKLVGWLLAWLFYWLGDLAWRVMESDDDDSWRWKLYPVYQKCMGWSYDIQKWGGDLGPWRKKYDG